MIIRLPNNRGNGFISALYPNASLSRQDSGLGAIGRIDHAFLKHNSIVPMHPHANDEILSYFRQGHAEHIDSENIQDTAHATRLMLMKAGKIYHHEEKILTENGVFEGLQIFMRPQKADGTPSVTFHDLDQAYSDNRWRLLASPNGENGLQFTASAWVFDTRLNAGQPLALPDFQPHLSYLLYVFQGEIQLNGETLTKKDSAIIKGENITLSTPTQAELVLFATDENAESFSGGMFSGNVFEK